MAAALHQGSDSALANVGGEYSLRTLANMYLEQQEAKLQIHDIGVKHYYDQVNLLRHFVKYIGADRQVSGLKAIDLQDYRTHLIRSLHCGQAVTCSSMRLSSEVNHQGAYLSTYASR